MAVITALDVVDVRFPTSRLLDGSDAMNPDPDYSAAYVTIRTDDGGADGSGDGYGLVFTIGRGNDVAVAAIEALATHVVGMPVPDRPERAGRAAPSAGGRLAAAMARPREGRHAHGDRRRAQRRLGPRQPTCRACRCGSTSPR